MSNQATTQQINLSLINDRPVWPIGLEDGEHRLEVSKVLSVLQTETSKSKAIKNNKDKTYYTRFDLDVVDMMTNKSFVFAYILQGKKEFEEVFSHCFDANGYLDSSNKMSRILNVSVETEFVTLPDGTVTSEIKKTEDGRYNVKKTITEFERISKPVTA